MISIRQVMMAGAAFALPAALMTTAANGAQPFYAGKTVTVFITSGSGGSVDLMNRLGARHLGKHLPGEPNVLAKNKTGAGGLVGANYIYNQAPKDGTELGGSLMAVPFAPSITAIPAAARTSSSTRRSSTGSRAPPASSPSPRPGTPRRSRRGRIC